MQGGMNGANSSDVEMLGRRFRETETNQSMARHYMCNVNQRAALAMGDFVPESLRTAFVMPRGRCLDVGNLDAIEKDNDFRNIVEFLVPNLIANTRRANNLLTGNTNDTVSPRSKLNHGFTSAFLGSVIIWIQDSVVMIEEEPDLYKVHPWSLLHEECIAEEWGNVIRRVKSDIIADADTDYDSIKEKLIF